MQEETREETGAAEKGKRRDAASDLRALRMLLRRTWRDMERPILVEGALWYAVVVLAVVLVGLAVAALLPGGYGIGRWVMGLGILSATLGAGSALGMFLWRRPGADAVARMVQRHSTEFRSDLVAALEFGERLTGEREALSEQGVSEALARAHLERTLRRATEVSEKSSLAHLVPRRELTPPILALSGALALMVIPFAINAGWTMGVLTGERLGSPVVGERVLQEPIVGHLEGVFVFPSYTGLDRQFFRLGSGYVEGLEGTQVHLTATLLGDQYEDVTLMLEVGEDQEPQAVEMRRENQRQATATIVLEDSGTYWFRARTEDGRPVEDRTPRRIRVARDEAPRVRLTSHEPGRVEVQPDEEVEFTFTVTDDFGVDTVTAVYYFEGGEDDAQRERLSLPGLSAKPREVDGGFTLDLQPLHLQPKDAVVVVFEARDTNSATGPGVGRSEAITLYVESPEDQHMRNLADQQAALEALLMHLADFLESPVGERERQRDGSYRQVADPETSAADRGDRFHLIDRLHRDRVEILTKLAGLVELMEEDPMVVPRNLTLFKSLVGRLDRLHQRGDDLMNALRPRVERNDLSAGNFQDLADYAAVTEEELEKGILSLEELLIDQKMELVKSTADEIEALRQRLRDLVEQFRDTQDPELKEAIQREIQRLRQRLQELMERMQMQMREMPREHVNLEAMEQMNLEQDTDSVADQLRSIEEMLESGDIDGALQMLDDMERTLRDLTQGMDDSFSEMEPQGISELDEAVAEMMEEVTQIEERERAIEEATRELQERMREERREELERQIAPLREELLREIRQLEREVQRIEERPLPMRDQTSVDRARVEVEALREMVEQDDLQQALERARETEINLRRMRSGMESSERFVNQEDQRQALRESRREATPMIERAAEIRGRLQEFLNQAQENLSQGDEQALDDLSQQQQELNQRAEALQQRVEEEGERFPALREELQPALESVREAMGEAGQSLEDRRMQPALDAERRAIEELGQLRQSMSQALERQRQEDRRQSGQEQSQERVEIPGQDSGEARERLRREMMEGMREGRLDDYESEIERYFRSLVE